MMDRAAAFTLLCEFTQSESLRRHGMAVETCLIAYARHFGEEEAPWALTGLLHDFDWEIHPQLPDHPRKGQAILAERGVDEVVRRAILSHAGFEDVPRLTRLEHALFACDELTGFLTAVSYVKPSRSIHEVDVLGVRKKMKDKAFARAVNRDDIVNGAAELGVALDEHIGFCLRAMQADAARLGIQGSAGAGKESACTTDSYEGILRKDLRSSTDSLGGFGRFAGRATGSSCVRCPGRN